MTPWDIIITLALVVIVSIVMSLFIINNMSSENKKSISKNFSRKRLVNSDLSNQDFIECDFRYSDLTGADISHANLFGSDFSGAKLIDVTLTINCRTFKNVKFDTNQIDQMIYLLSIANIDPKMANSLKELVGHVRWNRLNGLLGNKIDV